MSRAHIIYCDHCDKALGAEDVHIRYAVHPLFPHGITEGAVNDWDFCSRTCFDTWHAGRRLAGKGWEA